MQLQCTVKSRPWLWSLRAMSKHCLRPFAWVLDDKRDESTFACILLDVQGAGACPGGEGGSREWRGSGGQERVRKKRSLYLRTHYAVVCISRALRRARELL